MFEREGFNEFLSISKCILKRLLAANCGIHQLSKAAFPFTGKTEKMLYDEMSIAPGSNAKSYLKR